MSFKAQLLATAAGGLVLVAACGGGSSDTSSASSATAGSGTASSVNSSCQPPPETAMAGAVILTAPQLAVVANGPVTVTFLGASQPFGAVEVAWDHELQGVGFLPTTPIGTQFKVFDTLRPFGPGDNVTADAAFDSAASFSLTGASQRMIAAITPWTYGIRPMATMALNAGVVQSGWNTVLVGFNPPGMAQPSTFDEFAVRIRLSNVCVREG